MNLLLISCNFNVGFAVVVSLAKGRWKVNTAVFSPASTFRSAEKILRFYIRTLVRNCRSLATTAKVFKKAAQIFYEGFEETASVFYALYGRLGAIRSYRFHNSVVNIESLSMCKIPG